MVECGFAHSELNEMSEEEFIFWLTHRAELDELREEARKEAVKG